jgi:uncharacterized protein YbaR (Trm112 family)
MRPCLLDFLACPDCRSEKLDLHVEKYDAGGREIEEGSITCSGCKRSFAISLGIPRMLPASFTALEAPADELPVAGTLKTMQGYDFQHQRQGHYLSERESGADHDSDLDLTRQYFRKYLDLDEVQLEALKNRIVLDLGCGTGRFMKMAHEYGASEVIGLDLSAGGLLFAKSLLKDVNNCLFVQGNITSPPLRQGVVDLIYSIGVLHHLQFPEEGFKSLKPLLSKQGKLWVWCYGLEGMTLVYRLSHLIWLRQITKGWALERKLGLCKKMGFLFQLLYLYPLYGLKKLGLSKIIQHFPYNEWVSLDRNDIVYLFFDRLQPPFTHYLTKDQILQYLADLQHVSVTNTFRNGWVAKAENA